MGPAKRAKVSDVTPVCAAPDHPTIVQLKKCLDTIGIKTLDGLGQQDGAAHAGVHEFSEAEYRVAMKQAKEYECCIPIVWIEPAACVHPSLPPSWGAVERMAAQFFQNDGEWCPGSGLAETIQVRCVSLTTPPAKQTLQPLNGDPFRMAFFRAWAGAIEAKAQKAIKAFAQHARSAKVRFMYLPDDDEFERRKWILAENTAQTADAMVLVGLKRIFAVAGVQEMLHARQAPSTPEAVAAWLNRAKVKGVSDRVVKTMLKIHGRFVNQRRCGEIVEELDCAHGGSHALTNVSTLDILCAKTACPKTACRLGMPSRPSRPTLALPLGTLSRPGPAI